MLAAGIKDTSHCPRCSKMVPRADITKMLRQRMLKGKNMKYTIGFKSGAQIEFDVIDGEGFVEKILTGCMKNPSAHVQLYTEPGMVISVNEIEFVTPSHNAKNRE